MFDLDLYLTGLGAALGMGLGAWLVSLKLNDVSIVDSLWSLFFLLMVAVFLSGHPRRASAPISSSSW